MDDDDLIKKMFPGVFELNSKLFLLPAIWLVKPIRTKKGLTNRLANGDRVLFKNCVLTDCIGTPSHEIVQLYGRIDGRKFTIHAKHLMTDSIELIEYSQ